MTLHIVHLLLSFDTGGLQNGVVNLINHSDPLRLRHSVLSLTPALGMRERIQRDDVLVEAVDLGDSGRIGRRLGAWRCIARRLRQLAPDVLHSRNRGTQIDGALAGYAARVPVRIHGYHGRDLSNAQGETLRRRSLGRIAGRFHHGVITLTETMKREYRRDYGTPEEKIRVVPNGVDLERLEGFGADDSLRSPFTVCTVGRLDAVKNLPLLIRAFAAMPSREPGDRLVIAGEGPMRAELEALLLELGPAAAGVELLGERRDAPAVMKAADVYVQPSFYEGMSNTIVEAMALGVPVIATEVGGNADVTGRDGAARLLPSDDLKAMTTALDELRRDREGRRQLSHRGRERVRERFTMARMVEGYTRAYEEIGRRPVGKAG
jgi:sugar transferase (PEP-CTERM/EpsH1 system associated)